MASVAKDQTIRIWNVATGKVDQEISCEDGRMPNCLSFSKDGRFLWSGGRDGQLRQWTVANSRLIRSIKIDGESSQVCFSSESNSAIVNIMDSGHYGMQIGQSGCVTVDLNSGKIGSSFVDRRTPTVIGLSRNGRTAALSQSTFNSLAKPVPHIVVFRPDTGESLAEFSHDPVQSIISVSQTGRWVASVGLSQKYSRGKRELHLWDVANKRPVEGSPFPEFNGVTRLAFTKDDRHLVCATLNEIVVIRMDNRKLAAKLGGKTGVFALSPDGRTIALAAWPSISLWRLP